MKQVEGCHDVTRRGVSPPPGALLCRLRLQPPLETPPHVDKDLPDRDRDRKVARVRDDADKQRRPRLTGGSRASLRHQWVTVVHPPLPARMYKYEPAR